MRISPGSAIPRRWKNWIPKSERNVALSGRMSVYFGSVPSSSGRNDGARRRKVRNMSEDPRVQELLDQLADSRTTPEEVCKACPDLLPTVRGQWLQMQEFRAGLDAIFPPHDRPTSPPPEGAPVPQIPGYEIDGMLGRGG